MLAAMTKRLLSSNEILWSLMGVGRSDLKAPVAQVRGVVQQVIEAKQKSGTKKPEKEWDVLDRLMAESEDGERQFTVEEMQDEVLAFYMAGQDGWLSRTCLEMSLSPTSIFPAAMANALIWLLFALCNHPQHQDLIAEEVSRVVKDPNGRPTYEEATELKHLEACFKESLRYHTVLPGGSPRAVIAETEIGGYKIAPGTVVIASSQAMHMNQELWDGTADQYLPERWLKSKEKDKEDSGFMPFSDGPHMCPGYRLAHLQFKAWIAPLMRRYRCSLVPGQDLEPEEAVSTGLRKGLKVKLERR
jgi:cytochrome P450